MIEQPNIKKKDRIENNIGILKCKKEMVFRLRAYSAISECFLQNEQVILLEE